MPSKAPKKPYRPEPIVSEPVRCRVVRGPHPDDASIKPEDARWYWRIFLGNDCVEVLGWATVPDARRAAARQSAAHAEVRDTSGPAPTAGTVGALLDGWAAYMAARRDIKPRTKKNAAQYVGHLRAAPLADVRTSALRSADLDGYAGARSDAGAGGGTIAQEVGALRAAWAWGQGRGVVPDRAFPRFKLRISPVRDKYTPPDADIAAVVAALTPGWQRAALVLAAYGGLRTHEIAALTWDDVDLSPGAGLVRVSGETKTGAREVVLPDEAVTELRAFRDLPPASRAAGEAGYLLGVMPGNVPAKLGGFEGGAIGEACRVLGLRTFTPHGLRRAAVRRFRRAGVPLAVAAAHFGHSPDVMMKVYDEVDDHDRDDARRRVQAALRLAPSAAGTAAALPGPGVPVAEA
jgi:integrase